MTLKKFMSKTKALFGKNNITWKGLLELKQRYSGPDGLTSDLTQIGELQKYFNALPQKVREARKHDFAEMLGKGCNWVCALPFEQRIRGVDTTFEGLLFKDFFLRDDAAEKIRRLKDGLDKKSLSIIDTFIYRILQLPEFSGGIKYNVNIFGDHNELQKFLHGDYEVEAAKRYREELAQYRKQYVFEELGGSFGASVFLFHHGLRGKNTRVLDYIRGGDFIDGGAWLGDSALVLAQYVPRRIHSFELSADACAKYGEVMKANNISLEHAVIVNAGLGEKSGRAQASENACARGHVNLKPCAYDCVALDTYAAENELVVRFIKLDLEGEGLCAIKGAANTIRSQLPVLSIGFYHTPEEFFEIKPYIESLTDQYVFIVERHHIEFTHCCDTMLIAIPKFLI